VASLIALIFLGLAWELWLAPLKPGGSGLAWKVMPLLIPLFGILRGRVYTYRWASMLIIFYFGEGLVRAYSDYGLSAKLALAEIVLCAVFFAGSVSFIRATVRQDRGRDG
jgi:uncharacterized membrane protein